MIKAKSLKYSNLCLFRYPVGRVLNRMKVPCGAIIIVFTLLQLYLIFSRSKESSGIIQPVAQTEPTDILTDTNNNASVEEAGVLEMENDATVVFATTISGSTPTTTISATTETSTSTEKKTTTTVSHDSIEDIEEHLQLVNRHYDEENLVEWEPAAPVLGDPKEPGFLGAAVTVPPNLKPLADQRYSESQFNVVASEMIPYNRTLFDHRYPECFKKKYPNKLPQTSVVIVYHNEAWSTLIRTIWSVYTKSPRALLKEIILVDDKSTMSFRGPIEKYARLIPVTVKFIWLPERSGLTVAKLTGAKAATAPVITFIDSHCECGYGWLESLLARLVYNRQIVAVPIVEYINPSDMSVKNDLDSGQYGAFDWRLWFMWLYVPERERARVNKDKTAPLRTPCMVGGLFSVDREYFFKVGGYDQMMNFYGGENVEMTVRVWTCGGQVETVPCSRIAHMAKTHKPYTMPGGIHTVQEKNTARIVDVWFDEYKKLYYAATPQALQYRSDVTERANLRRDLKCRPFKWFIENIYPESTYNVPYLNVGSIVSVANPDRCIDTLHVQPGEPIGTYKCHYVYSQIFMLSTKNELRVDYYCLEAKFKDSIRMYPCHNLGLAQKFNYDHDTKVFKVGDEDNCLTMSKDGELTLQTCNYSTYQQWRVTTNLKDV